MIVEIIIVVIVAVVSVEVGILTLFCIWRWIVVCGVKVYYSILNCIILLHCDILYYIVSYYDVLYLTGL